MQFAFHAVRESDESRPAQLHLHPITPGCFPAGLLCNFSVCTDAQDYPHLRCRHLDFIQANDKAGSKSESSEGQPSAIATLSKQHSSLNHSCYYWKSEVINVSLSTFSLAPLYSIPNTWWPSHVLIHYIFKLRRRFWHLLAWLQTHFYYHDIFFMTVLFFSSSNKTGVQKYIPKIVPLTN